ncbi:MAG: chitobiase/beta-hexosaminidase C-terminal domain-containing protein [Patescibacteria group bacterium]
MIKRYFYKTKKINFIKIFFLLIFSAIFILLLAANATEAAGWTFSTLDENGDVGGTTSLAIDSNNNIHIAYHDSTNKDLKYTTNISGAWQIETVASENYVGEYPSLVLDSDNNIYISYYDRTNSKIKLARKNLNSSSWTIETIDPELQGPESSLAIDSNDKLHIAYKNYDGSKHILKYANNISGSFSLSLIDESANINGRISLALDSDNKPHISYYQTSNLRYASNLSDSTWTIATIDNSGDVGDESFLRFDSNNRAHIVYYDWSNTALKYATDASGSWQKETIDNTEDDGYYNSVAVNSDNKVLISYYDWTNGNLKYTTNSSDSWQAAILDSDGRVGGYTSLALDSYNRIHIVYYDFINGDLKYAQTSGPSSPSVSINSDASYTNSQNITLILSASGDAAQMLISENSDFSGASWETYAISKSFTLSSGDGTKTVYVKFRDQWRAETDTVSDTIILDTTAPTTTAAPSGGTYKSIKKITLSSTDALLGIDKIYYTIDGLTPTTSSKIYTKPFKITRDITIKYFAADISGNREQIKTSKYKIKKARFVFQKAKSTEEKITKKNKTYYANDFNFLFSKFPKKLQKKKYYLKIQRKLKYPLKYKKAKKLILKKYWIIKTNFNKYKPKTKKDKFNLKLIFEYSDKELKKLKENFLVLKYYNQKIKKWQKLSARHNKKKNTFTIFFNKFFSPTTYFAVGKK